jgi:hypothetical protein
VWIARRETLLSRLQVRSVNSNIVVVIVWTNAKDSGVLIKASWLDRGNVETAVISGGLPNGLRILDKVIDVEDISIVALNPFCSALLNTHPMRSMIHKSGNGTTYSENNANGFGGKRDDNNFRFSRATVWGEVNSAQGWFGCVGWHVEM